MARFTFYGGMTMEVVRSDGFKVLCDPYISENPFCAKTPSDFIDANLLLVTHAAYDHYGDAAEIMKGSRAKIICGREVFEKIRLEYPDVAPDRFIPTVYGDSRTVDGVLVRTVPAWHGSGVMLDGKRFNYNPFGFIVNIEPRVTYYHTGDTCLFSDMRLIRELYKPNVMAVGISRVNEGLPCEMDPHEAALAVGMVSPDVAIPCHYCPGDSSLAAFMREAPVIAPFTLIKPEIERAFIYEPSVIRDCENR